MRNGYFWMLIVVVGKNVTVLGYIRRLRARFGNLHSSLRFSTIDRH
jgi:hypothetical protein